MGVITIRVSDDIKEKLEKYHVNVSEAVRSLLEKYVSDLESRDLAEKLEMLRERVGSTIDPRLVSELVREDRDRR